MILIQANNIKKSFGAHQVLNGASLVLNERERVGMIGANGCGKTTFLQCLTGRLEPDHGECSKVALTTIGYLQQLPEVEAGCSAWDAIMDGFPELFEQRSELARLEQEMGGASDDMERIMVQYARITEAYERANGYAAETIARRVLTGLGFERSQFSQEWASFSGGEKTRLNLARLLVTRQDILLLDEPTNHLDFRSVEWLEEFLDSYAGTLLVVSHDRRFLERVATRIVHLQNGRIKSYPGTYSQYLKQRAEEELGARRAYEKQQEYIRRTEEYIRRFKAGIKAKQARGRQSQLDRLERLEKEASSRSISLSSPARAGDSGQIVLHAEGLKKAYGDKAILNETGLTIRKGDRLALVGPNGCGKTTLLQILAGRIPADAGDVRLGSRVSLAYFDQENESLHPGNTVLDEVIYSSALTLGEARNRLGAMLFTGDEVFKPVAALSGGERARLTLLKMMIPAGNLLILDEPTNHLDIDSRQVVEDLLSQYPGTLLVVSHDRYFLDQVANSVLTIEDGQIVRYDGNFSTYQERMQERTREKAAAPDKAEQLEGRSKKAYRTGISEEEKAARRTRRQLKNQIEEQEIKIAALEEHKTNLEDLLGQPQTYQEETVARQHSLDLKQVSEQLVEALEEWERLMALQIEIQPAEGSSS